MPTRTLLLDPTVLAISARPDLLHGADQPGRAVGHDQPWRGEPTGDQIAAEIDPVRATTERDVFPSPASSHSDSTSRIDSPMKRSRRSHA